jgi:RNA polymerase sigma-70 factor (ECF subfamily)
MRLVAVPRDDAARHLVPVPSVASAPALSADEAIDELLRRTGLGDQVAFARLYDAVIGLVLGVARLLVGPDDAEDLAEQACLDVWRMSPAYPTSGSGPLAWVTARVEQASPRAAAGPRRRVPRRRRGRAGLA